MPYAMELDGTWTCNMWQSAWWFHTCSFTDYRDVSQLTSNYCTVLFSWWAAVVENAYSQVYIYIYANCCSKNRCMYILYIHIYLIWNLSFHVTAAVNTNKPQSFWGWTSSHTSEKYFDMKGEGYPWGFTDYQIIVIHWSLKPCNLDRNFSH